MVTAGEPSAAVIPRAEAAEALVRSAARVEAAPILVHPPATPWYKVRCTPCKRGVAHGRC